MSTHERGYTLIEFLVCVSFLGLLVLAVTRLEYSVRVTEKHFQFGAHERSAIALLGTMNSDIHSATRLKQVDARTLVVEGPAGVITWKSSGTTAFRMKGKMRQVWRVPGGVEFSRKGGSMVELRIPAMNVRHLSAVRGGIQ